MRDPGALVRDITFLARAAQLLQIPVVATEQYPKGLGPTVPGLTPLLGHAPIAKLAFSCLGCDPFKELLATMGRRQVVVAGIEAHVCVLQTTLDLLESGNQVFLPLSLYKLCAFCSCMSVLSSNPKKINSLTLFSDNFLIFQKYLNKLSYCKKTDYICLPIKLFLLVQSTKQ